MFLISLLFLRLLNWIFYFLFLIFCVSLVRAVRKRYIGLTTKQTREMRRKYPDAWKFASNRWCPLAGCGSFFFSSFLFLLFSNAMQRFLPFSFLDLENVPRLSYLPIVRPFPFSKLVRNHSFRQWLRSVETNVNLHWLFAGWSFLENQATRIS